MTIFTKRIVRLFVGIAKNMALYKGYHIHDKVISNFLKYRMNWEFLDRTVNYMDFIGINYYGEEIVKNFSLFLTKRKNTQRPVEVSTLVACTKFFYKHTIAIT